MHVWPGSGIMVRSSPREVAGVCEGPGSSPGERMGELLEELKSLQAVALELVGIEQNRESKRRRVSARERQVRLTDERLERNRQAARQLQVRIDNLSLEIASREESISHHRQALNRAKTNKEYASILAAMNTEKADTAKVEAAGLELMKELEALDQEANAIEEEKARLVADAEKAKATLEKYETRCAPEREELESKRRDFAEHIAPEALAIFDRAAQRHDGEAMAAVIKERPKGADYTCGGCNMKVTLEAVNALQSRGGVQKCGVCGRILYLETTAASR